MSETAVGRLGSNQKKKVAVKKVKEKKQKTSKIPQQKETLVSAALPVTFVEIPEIPQDAGQCKLSGPDLF